MLKQSKASEPSISAPIVSAVAKRSNASAVRMKGQRVGNLLERRAPSASFEWTALETELKLSVTTEDLDVLKNHPIFRSRKSSAKGELVSIYFDTKDRVLNRHGLSFRLRRKGEQLRQTIKGMHRGVLERSERETPFICDGDDLPGSIDSFLQHLDRDLPTALKPIFKTRIDRESYEIEGIEVCLDKGEIIAGRRSSPVAEIELELKKGDRRQLFALARKISRIAPAEMSVKSKSERGYDLIDRARVRAVMARDPILPPSADVYEAVQIICGECLHHLISNISGVRAHEAEALHQARVALRRFDAALRLFGKALSERKASKVSGELKWIGDELATARELDVFIADILVPLRSEHPKDSSVAEVHRSCSRQREQEYARGTDVLDSQRFRAFLIDVAEWIEVERGQRKAGLRLQREPSVKALASKALSKIWSKMKAGKGIDELDLHNLHKLRLRAKRIRYMTEFTRGLYEAHPRRIESVIRVLGKLQSALGTLNDIASGTAILVQGPAERLTGHRNGKLRITSGLAAELVRGLERRKCGKLKKAARAFDRLEEIRPFWT